MINNRGGWEGDFHVRERRIDGMRTDKPWDSNDCIAGFLGLYSGQTSAAAAPADSESGFNRRAGRQLSVEYRPDGTGKMDEEQVERLRQAGEWLSKYGETLYGLRAACDCGPLGRNDVPRQYCLCAYSGMGKRSDHV